MKTLFGIRSNVAIVAVGFLYLIISLHTSIHEIKYFKEYNSQYDDDGPSNGYLLIDTNTDAFHIISLTLSLSCLLSSILLILGIAEKRYGIIRPWLLFNFLLESIFISMFFYLLLLFVEVHQSNRFNACGLLALIFSVSIATVYHTYVWNGSYSLYDKFQKQSLRLYRIPDADDMEAVDTV